MWAPIQTPVDLGAHGTAIGSGLTNTQKIYNNFQASYPNGNYAAKYAYTNCGTGSISDGWFLPNQDEMSAVMTNLIKENCSTTTYNYGKYWTSTQSSQYNGNAMSIDCRDGSAYNNDDLQRFGAVRPVKYFTR